MEEPRTGPDGEAPFRIDYDRLDVADLMAQVEARAAARPDGGVDEASAPGEPENPDAYPEPPAEDPGSRVRRLLRRLLRPFAPLIKVAILPVYEDLQRAVRQLDYAHRRLDFLTRALEAERARLALTQEKTKLLHNLAHNLVVELTKLKIEHEALKSKTRLLEKDLETQTRRERSLETRVLR